MANREVVGRLVRDIAIGVYERKIRITDYIGIRLIFHYDDENIISFPNLGGWAASAMPIPVPRAAVAATANSVLFISVPLHKYPRKEPSTAPV